MTAKISKNKINWGKELNVKAIAWRDMLQNKVHREPLRRISRTERERERGKVRSSLSSVTVERKDALELPGTNSSSSKNLFLAIPIFQKELFITPLAKYNKKWMGSGMASQSITTCPRVTCRAQALLVYDLGFWFCINICSTLHFSFNFCIVVYTRFTLVKCHVWWVKPHEFWWVHWAEQPLESASALKPRLRNFYQLKWRLEMRTLLTFRPVYPNGNTWF